MFSVRISGALNSCQAHLDMNLLHETSACKSTHVSPLVNTKGSTSPIRGLCNRGVQSCSFTTNLSSQLKIQYLSHQLTSKIALCRSNNSTSPENEYRSSRNIATSLFRRYRKFVERGGGDNLKEFISAGVNAYALGCTDESLREELTDMKESGVEIDAMQAYSGNTGLKSKIFSQEIDECILWLSIVFITILCTPQPTIVRWSSTPPVSEKMMLQWKGFCAT